MDTDQTSAAVNTLGFIFTLIFGTLLLLSLQGSSGTGALFTWCIIYVVALLVFWPIQIVYHLYVHKGQKPSLLRRVDRASMLLMLAAIYSPIFYVIAPDMAYKILVSILWILMAVGTFLIIKKKEMPRHLSPILSFIMGIIAIVGFSIFSSTLSAATLTLFALGTLFLLSAGAVYAVQKPKLNPEIYGFHEFFHTLLAIGIILYHFLIVSIV